MFFFVPLLRFFPFIFMSPKSVFYCVAPEEEAESMRCQWDVNQCMFLLSSTLVSFVYSSKWVYLKPRHRNQTATTVKCSQLQWLPPSSPASRGKYRAGRGEDPRFAMSLSWISPAATLTRSLRSKCQRRGGESRVSRSAGWGGYVVWVQRI